MSGRTTPCDQVAASGRMKKAEQFFEAAETIRELATDEADVADAYVTLCVHAGIAAADVVCCIELSKHAQGEGHNEAVALLGQVHSGGPPLSRALGALLGMKTWAGYSHRTVLTADRKRAGRAAERLLGAARDRVLR